MELFAAMDQRQSCLGKPTKVSAKAPRKPMVKKTVFIEP